MAWLLPLMMAFVALALLAARVRRREAAALAAAEGDLARLCRCRQDLARRLDLVTRPVEEAPVPRPAAPVPAVSTRPAAAALPVAQAA